MKTTDDKGFKPQEDVDMFMSAADQALRYVIPDDPTVMFDEDQAKLYMDLVTEEYKETKAAFDDKDVVGVADGVADMVWVIMGLASTLGIDFYKVWEAIYASNMSKIEGGRLIKDPKTGKVMKPEGYFPPNIKEALDL